MPTPNSPPTTIQLAGLPHSMHSSSGGILKRDCQRSSDRFRPHRRESGHRALVLHNLGKVNVLGVWRRPPRTTVDLPITTFRAQEPPAYPISSMLRERLVRCPALPSGAPVKNQSPLVRAFEKAHPVRRSWTASHHPTIRQVFLSALYMPPSLKTNYVPQVKKLLESEGDVGDAVVINVILPAVHLLNQLLSPAYRDDFVITVQHQTSLTTESAHSIYVDHAIVLLDRRGFSLAASKPNLRRQRVYLLIVEEKKAGFVRPEGWDISFRDANAKTLIPQGLMYSHHFDCRRVLFTDYQGGAALFADKGSASQNGSFEVSTHQCHSPRGGSFDPVGIFHDPMNLGLRSATLYMAVCALNELGVLDYDRIDVPRALRPGQLDARLQEIRSHPAPPPKPEHSWLKEPAVLKFAHPGPRKQPPRKAKI